MISVIFGLLAVLQVAMLKFVRLELGSRSHGLRPILLPTFFYAVSVNSVFPLWIRHARDPSVKLREGVTRGSYARDPSVKLRKHCALNKRPVGVEAVRPEDSLKNTP